MDQAEAIRLSASRAGLGSRRRRRAGFALPVFAKNDATTKSSQQAVRAQISDARDLSGQPFPNSISGCEKRRYSRDFDEGIHYAVGWSRGGQIKQRRAAIRGLASRDYF
jgi:hypothetical protein